VIDIENVIVRYGAVVALRGVSLRVDAGEAVSVIGPNGAGKTSLLRCIAGAIKPAGGRVLLDGERISGKAAHAVSRKGVVLVPEGRAILAPLTVRQNLQMGGYTKTKTEVRDRIDEMCTLFPVLGRRLDSPGGLLSGGEQQMLAIARGLMADPRLLMFDEPSMGLAPRIVDNILEALQQVTGRGTSILLAEQNAALALDVTDRSYVLVSGEIVGTGVGAEIGEDLLERYLS
jgi:branched-chain amino acid transport system ATP-binding protein